MYNLEFKYKSTHFKDSPSIPFNGQREIKPTHPGEMLREDFMADYNPVIPPSIHVLFRFGRMSEF